MRETTARQRAQKALESPLSKHLGPRGGVVWVVGDRWHIKTDCGFYTVSRATVSGEARYSSWFRPKGNESRKLDWPILLGTFHKPDEAQQCCENHKAEDQGKA